MGTGRAVAGVRSRVVDLPSFPVDAAARRHPARRTRGRASARRDAAASGSVALGGFRGIPQRAVSRGGAKSAPRHRRSTGHLGGPGDRGRLRGPATHLFPAGCLEHRPVRHHGQYPNRIRLRLLPVGLGRSSASRGESGRGGDLAEHPGLLRRQQLGTVAEQHAAQRLWPGPRCAGGLRRRGRLDSIRRGWRGHRRRPVGGPCGPGRRGNRRAGRSVVHHLAAHRLGRRNGLRDQRPGARLEHPQDPDQPVLDHARAFRVPARRALGDRGLLPRVRAHLGTSRPLRYGPPRR